MNFSFIFCLLFASLSLSSQRPNEPVNDFETRDAAETALQLVESSPVFQQLKDTFILQSEIADIVLPVMVRALTSPLPGLADALQRSLALFGVTSYLVGPTIARSARELGPMVEPIVGSTDGLVRKMNKASELQPLFNNVLTILGINNEPCKEAIACQAGQVVSRDYPILARYLSQAGSADDKFSNILVTALSSENIDCASDCPNLAIIKKYWKESEEKDLLTLTKDAISNNLQ